MTKIHFVLFGIALLLFINLNAQNGVQYPSGIDHVIVIGIDGMSPDGIRTASTPVMHQLIKQGSVKWNVRTVLPSSSSPNWASMIMGAGTEAHGITDNDWGRQEYTLPPIVSNEDGIFPTIFGWIRKNRPNAEIGVVYQWTGFGRLFEKRAVNYDKNMADEVTTTKTFSAYIKTKKPLFAFMHLDHVDDAGHEEGHGTPGYYRAVSKADSLIGIIVQSIKDAGIEKNTLLIITADHGGVGYGHGGATLEEAEIATIFYGKGVKKGYVIQQQVYTYDLAATIAFALHIIPPYAWTGRAVKPAFNDFKEPVNLYLGKTIIPSPKIFPWKYLYQKAGGLYIDSTALVSMQSIADNVAIHFTTDGNIPDSNSRLYKDPFTLDKTTIITARNFDKSGNASQPVTAYFRIASSKEGHGLNAVFYPGYDWNHLPVLSTMISTHQWNCYEFSLNREQILPWLGKDSSSFGITMQGSLQIDVAGKYSFYTQSDDGSKLFIDNNAVVNNDGDHGVIERSGDVELGKGNHLIKVEYYNGQGGFWLDVLYKGPNVPKQIIPANKLYKIVQ